MTRCVLALLFLLSLAGAQEAPQPGSEPCLHKSVAVRIVDRKSQRGISDLAATNFQPNLRGKPIQVLSATLDRGLRRVLVMLDVSGSMVDSQEKWEIAQKLAATALESTRPYNSAAFIAFASTIEQKVGFPAGYDAALAAARSLPSGPAKFDKKRGKRTATFDALKEGLDLFGNPAFGDTIILITDGEDNASRMSVEDLSRLVTQRGIRVLVLLLPYGSPTLGSLPVSTLSGPVFLPDGSVFAQLTTSGQTFSPPWVDLSLVAGLAEQSGGQILLVEVGEIRKSPSPTLAGINARLALLANELYRLNLELAEPLPKPSRWNLKVVDQNGKDLKNAEILFPRKIAACSGN